MAKLTLDGGFYVAKSLIAGAQRCLNLYPEKNPPDSPFPVTHYLTPGLSALVTPATGMVRCLYRASTGELYAVVARTVYYVDSSWTAHALGTIDAGTSIVSMADNRLVIVIVDGTAKGYYIDLEDSRSFGEIIAPAFYGADRVEYDDTFFVFNRPATQQFYLSDSEITGSLIRGGAIIDGNIVGGRFYTNGTHLAVPLTGGTGSGAIADIIVAANSVTTVTIDFGGQEYVVGDELTAAASALGGAITGSTITAGQQYTNGTYTAVPLTGGKGTNAVATIVVAGGKVTSATITNPGQDYVAGDVLSASASLIGTTGTGFALNVSTVASNGTDFTYTVTEIDQGSGAFDPLFIASKSGSSDTLVAVCVMHRELYLIGQLTSEIWTNAGAPDFPFQELPGVFWEHGSVAVYSIAHTDLSMFWVSQDKEGQGIILMGSPYEAKRISTHAIEAELAKYTTLADAIGFCYQQGGHSFYQLTFPSADKTWVYDLATGLWHERAWIDDDGVEHRHRANCAAFVYGVNIVGDWQNGTIYNLDQTAGTDDGQPIKRVRSFPHLLDEAKRLSYDRFVAEMEVGTASGTLGDRRVDFEVQANPDGDTGQADPDGDSVLAFSTANFPGPSVSLRYSDTRGKSWGDPIEISFGAEGDFATSMQARQLGMGRDRVFELSWSGDFITALNGAFIDVTPAET